MKRLLILSLVSAQLAAGLAHAASLDEPTAVASRSGAFVGARFRIPFGGERAGQPRAGLALTGLHRSQGADGAMRLRYSEGAELGFAADQPLALSIAGRPVAKRKLGLQNESEEDDGGIPTWALVVGGVVIVAGIGAALFVDAVHDASE